TRTCRLPSVEDRPQDRTRPGSAGRRENMQVGAEDSAAHCWTAYAWSYDGDVMNGPDDLTKRPPDGDGESWALPAPETPATSAPYAAPASAPAPSSAPRRGRSRFGTALLAVVVGASVVVGS